MGYWGKHPMSGDLPLDALYDLDELLFTKEERRDGVHYNQQEYAKRLKEKLNEAAEMKYYSDMNFVLPFKIVELKIRIEDKELSQKIKNMIGDGGAEDRGYPTNIESNHSNRYNNFENPYDFARQLIDNWDGLMDGTIDFDILQKPKGLFQTIIEHTGEGLVNVE